ILLARARSADLEGNMLVIEPKLLGHPERAKRPGTGDAVNGQLGHCKPRLPYAFDDVSQRDNVSGDFCAVIATIESPGRPLRGGTALFGRDFGPLPGFRPGGAVLPALSRDARLDSCVG